MHVTFTFYRKIDRSFFFLSSFFSQILTYERRMKHFVVPTELFLYRTERIEKERRMFM